MDYKQIIIDSITYIEEHIDGDISPSSVATEAGYSEYHFYRMFRHVTGVTLTQFIIKRRLKHAIYAIAHGQRMLDGAITYGFYTHAGFFKAFKKEYGCSPSYYLKHNVVRKPSVYVLEKESKIMITDMKLKQILAHWDLKVPYTIDGVYNDEHIRRQDQWIINKRYILKATQNKKKVTLNVGMTQALLQEEVLTPPFVGTREKKNYLEAEGCYFFMKPIMTTTTLTVDQVLGDKSGQVPVQLGEKVGLLHKILVGYEEQADYDDVSLYEVVNRWAMPEVRKMMGDWEETLPEDFFEDYKTTFGKLSKALPRQIIHRNMHLFNMLYRDGDFAGYGDFELVEKNVRLFDPCYLATSILAELFDDEERMKKWPIVFKYIIRGYDRIASLTEVEKQSLMYVLYSIQMIFIAYFGKQNDYELLAQDNFKGLCWLYEHREALSDTF